MSLPFAASILGSQLLAWLGGLGRACAGRFLLPVLGIFAFGLSPLWAEIALLDIPTPSFRPDPGIAVEASQAELRLFLDATASRYRLDALRLSGGIAAQREIVHKFGLGEPQEYRILVPLEEGLNQLQVRAVDLNQSSVTATSPSTGAITRDLGNEVFAVRLDHLEPFERNTQSAEATVVFTIRGSASSYAAEVFRNGVSAGFMAGLGPGTQRIENIPLTPGENFLTVQVLATDPLSTGTTIESKPLRLVSLVTPPSLSNVVVSNPALPTDQAVIQIQGETDPFATVRIESSAGETYFKRADSLGSFSVAGVDLPLVDPGPTTTTYTVTAFDLAGNASAPANLSATRNPGNPRFEFLRLFPTDGAQIRGDTPVRISGLAGMGADPYTVRFLSRRAGGPQAIEETFEVLGDANPFEKDVLFTADPANPGTDVVYALSSEVRSPVGTSGIHFLGSLTLDVADPPAVRFLDGDLEGIQRISGGSFTVSGAAEQDATVQFGIFNGVVVQPSNQIPVIPTPIVEGGEFRSVVFVDQLPDGEYSLRTTVVATSGRTGPISERSIPFVIDRTPPFVEVLRIDGVDSASGRDLFRRRANLVSLSVRMSEPLTSPPIMHVTQTGRDAVRAVLTGQPVPFRVFEYLAVVEDSTEFDGPVEVVVSGGQDLAGNSIFQPIRFPAAFVVDTTPPSLDPTRTIPADGSLITSAPPRIRAALVELENTPRPVSGPDPARSSIRITGPLETTPDQVQTGRLEVFDPVTLDFFPDRGTFSEEGTYQVEVTSVDRVGNQTTNVLVYFLDSTAPSQDFVVATTPSADQAFRFETFPRDALGNQALFAEFDVSSPGDLDLSRTTLALESYCPIPASIAGTTRTTGATREFVLDRNLAADGSQDGFYTFEIQVADPAGNRQFPVRVDFVYDNIAPRVLDGNQFSVAGSNVPTTEGNFPRDQTLVHGPLLEVSSLIQDGVSVNGFTGSGLRLSPTTGTSIHLTLLETHPSTTIPVGFSTRGMQITTLQFEEDPDIGASPCYVDTRRSRALLGLFPDPLSGEPVGFPANGSFDGRWQIEVTPVDRAGNVGEPQVTEFLYDTIPPFLEVATVLNDRTLTGDFLEIEGMVRDNDKGPLDLGLGIARVEVRLEAVLPNPVTTLPALIEFTEAILTPAPDLVQAETLLPWRFRGRIPAYEGPGRLVLRALDQAGNETLLVRDLQIQSSSLRAPKLLRPPNREDQPGALVEFEWEEVEGASGYRVSLIDEAGNQSDFDVERGFVQTRINLAPFPEGRYTWTVRALDAAGSPGEAASMRTFSLDKVPPRLLEAFSFDPSAPDEFASTIFGNQIRLGLRFSEAMDTTTPPRVFLEPARPGVPDLEVVPVQFLGESFRGVVDVPPDAGFPDVNGFARIRIEGAKDPAGNLLLQTQESFEIDIGPYWEVRAFANPILKRELIFTFRAHESFQGPLETVANNPKIFVKQEGDPQGRFLVLRRLSPSVFQGTFEVDQTLPGSAQLEIASTDLRGNTSRRRIQFSIAKLLRADQSTIRISSGLTLRVPAQAVDEDTTVVLVPAELDGASLPERLSDELEVVSPFFSTLPQAIPLQRPATLRFSPQALSIDPKSTKGLGIFLVDGDSARWVGSLEAGEGAAEIEELGRLYILRDQKAPEIQGQEIQAGSRAKVQLSDQGSGIDPEALEVWVQGRKVPHRYQHRKQEVWFDLPESLGPVEVDLRVQDRTGNAARKVLGMQPATLAVQEFAAAPNPARVQVWFRVRLAASGTRARIQIYDTAGRRIRLLSLPASAGPQTIPWDLRTSRGRPVRNGVYFAELEVQGPQGKLKARQKIAVLR